jgi:hypothetical protein
MAIKTLGKALKIRVGRLVETGIRVGRLVETCMFLKFFRAKTWG